MSLSFTGNNDPGDANLIACWVEDDGQWSPPDEVWDWVSEPYPVGVRLSILRADSCAYEIAPGQYVHVWAGSDVGYSVTITD